ncbi:response regulator [Oscillospiraceae bacterium PP1C4]
MYRALIVDDEMAARETLKCIIDWIKVGFDAPVTAKNGQQAWELYQQEHFDIVITDIEMPLMNGLQLIENIRSVCPSQKIVIISCHERFDYARQAIRLGVEDYLIKDLLKPEELYAYVLNIKSVLNEQNQFRHAQYTHIVNDSIRKLICREPLTEPERSTLRMQLNLDAKQTIAAMMVVVDSYGKLRSQSTGSTWFENMERFKASLCANSLACIEFETGQYFILYQAEGNFSVLNFMNSSIQYANFLRTLSKESGIPSLSIGISNPSGKLDDIPELYRQSVQACGMRVIVGLNKNILYNGIGNKPKTFDKDVLDHSLKEVKQLLFERDTHCIQQIKRLYSADLIDGFMEVNYYNYLNTRLYGILIAYIDRQGFDYGHIFSGFPFHIKAVDQLETVKEMVDYFCRAIGLVLSYNAPPINEDGMVQKAKKIVEQNFGKDISLNEIAEMLHVHKGHLCRVFKEETGENLMQYVVTYKIEKAKIMLVTTSMKLSEISDSLGFATPQYFSTVFKKLTSLTPINYKKQIGKGR